MTGLKQMLVMTLVFAGIMKAQEAGTDSSHEKWSFSIVGGWMSPDGHLVLHRPFGNETRKVVTTDMKAGPSVGTAVLYRLNDRWSIGAGVHYESLRYSTKEVFNPLVVGMDCTLYSSHRIHNVSVYLEPEYNLIRKANFRLYGSPHIAFTLFSPSIRYISERTRTDDLDSIITEQKELVWLNEIGLGVSVGAEWKLSRRLYAGIRVQVRAQILQANFKNDPDDPEKQSDIFQNYSPVTGLVSIRWAVVR